MIMSLDRRRTCSVCYLFPGRKTVLFHMIYYRDYLIVVLLTFLGHSQILLHGLIRSKGKKSLCSPPDLSADINKLSCTESVNNYLRL